MSESKGSLQAVNEAMFRELERLEAINIEDVDKVNTEISRAKAVQGIADTVIANGRLVVDVARASADVGEKVRIPKGLLA